MSNTSRLSEMQRQRAATLLDSQPLFAGLDPERRRAMLEHLSLFVLATGEVLFRQREPARHLFLLATGQVKLARVSDDGGEKIISLVRPGESFAEAVMFSQHHLYPVTATALVESTAWGIDAAYYRRILAGSTDACFAILARISERLHQQVAEIERLTLHTATARLVNYLLDRVDTVEGLCVSVTLDAPKQVIASRLSIVPATFSRVLARLVHEGLIEVHEDRIDLLDHAALRELAKDVLV